MSSKGKSSAEIGSGTHLVPRLRFPEFQTADGWKETSLQKLARPVTDRAKTGDADNVLSLSGEHGLVLQSDYFRKKIAGDSTDRYLKIRKDDFVYNDRTTKASSFGTIKRLSNYSSGIVSPIYKCFRFQPSENPAFWEWYFESGSHDSALGGLVNEGARAGRFNISVTQFLSTKAWLPDEAEQKKIADVLDSVDGLIATQGRRVEALRVHKNGLMQQLFPQEGETQPRLRFPEFQNALSWEPTKIGDLGSFYYGKSAPKWSLAPDAPTPCVRYGELYSTFGPVITKTYSRTNIDPSTLRFSKGGEILVPRVGEKPEDFGKCCCYLPLSNIAIGEMISVFETDQDPLFYTYYFRKLYRQFAKVVEGQNVKNLYYVELEPIPLFRPSIPEQVRIAGCLSSVDDLITAETRKLDTLKTHKKGLMQQLFPCIGEANV